MAADGGVPQPPKDNPNGISEREIRKESSKAARKARQAQRKAYELRQAAYGAGDPEERQKLLEEAIDREAEAESFGKLAKYMRRGSFQGMAVGAGLGVIPGLTLGSLTGILVGGLVSMITGGLGAAGGMLVGAIHGPFWNMGEIAGKGIQKLTGNLPGWIATDEQKWYLEHMLGQAKEEEMPTAHELEFLQQDDGSTDWGTYVERASSWIPTVPSRARRAQPNPTPTTTPSRPPQPPASSPPPPPPPPSAQSPESTQLNRSAARQANQKAGDALALHLANPLRNVPSAAAPPPPPSSAPEPAAAAAKPSKSPLPERKPPRKLETRTPSQSHVPAQTTPAAAATKRQPRKLERRGQA